MEFIKLSKDKYMIKNSQFRVIDEKEKLELEKEGLILKDVTSKDCQKETTKAIKKINKKLEEIENETIEETKSTD